ncbi:MAG: AraC family transcriptional regulator [Hydrogenophaga sp.]|uniref:helix-turn-helix transcriptional regulator n=1 Tax=Hydrogenophaga sp. TaxID=1904254 RepID=UPI00260DA644|nr:AraC family transcriptional regulator [Hydrogenophaga sp.]MCV0438324.1 AraC family transcriptional regulator [Hydrogenophaga sp.]
MPNQQQTVQIPSPAAPPRSAPWREDDFNAMLLRSSPERARTQLMGRQDEASRSICWPSDGGRITRVRTTAWEGAQALYFDFRLNDDLHVQIDPSRELLLTFFLEGRVQGQVGGEHGASLDFHTDRALLRTPNAAGGFLIHIPGGCRNHFVQFRLRRELVPHWLRSLGVRLPMRQIDELTDRDDGHVLCNAALTPRVRSCLARIRDEPVDQAAFVPLFHARSMELLTCVLLDIERLLHRKRSAATSSDSSAQQATDKVRALVAEQPARAWTVAALAQQVGCSSARLQQRVREASGDSVYRLIVTQRLELAARLLRETHLGIQHVASETGWECHGRFTAAFRAHLGMGPRDYRLRHGAQTLK